MSDGKGTIAPFVATFNFNNKISAFAHLALV